MTSSSVATDMAHALSTAPIAARPTGALAATDQQRAIAEVQAALLLARANPRDPLRAIDLIKQDCARPGLAERALYSYARGGTAITGPSIRLAEAIALRYGNISYGIRELEQRPGESVMQAYAWDVETNTRREMTFTVPHVRDTRGGRVTLQDTRDIYEAVSNSGARRLRACILGIIPGDIVDEAVDQVETTLKAKAEVTPERIKRMVETFASHGVSQAQLEKRVQRHLTVEALTPALMLQLGKIANSLRDGMSTPGDWFEGEAPTAENGTPPASRVEAVKAKLLKGRKAPEPPALPERESGAEG